MTFGRYKNFDWDQARINREMRLRRVTMINRCPDCMLASACALTLQSLHRGPWRMIYHLIRYEIRQVWWFYFGNYWERVRVFFGFPPDPVLSEAQRALDEVQALEELGEQL